MNPTNIDEAYSLINYIKKSLKIRNENLWGKKIIKINIVLSTLTGIIHWIIVI
jgi:hypothetical protein